MNELYSTGLKRLDLNSFEFNISRNTLSYNEHQLISNLSLECSFDSNILLPSNNICWMSFFYNCFQICYSFYIKKFAIHVVYAKIVDVPLNFEFFSADKNRLHNFRIKTLGMRNFSVSNRRIANLIIDVV